MAFIHPVVMRAGEDEDAIVLPNDSLLFEQLL